MNKLISLLAGIIFGTGLVISEMINPEKVLSFLDVFGNWDPSLAFVMIGALIISSNWRWNISWAWHKDKWRLH